MWKLVHGSVRGTSHAQSGQPCQDYCAGTVVGTTAVAACADGAGSAERSHLGSRVAVERFMEEAARCSLESAPTRETIASWVDAARGRVLEEAEELGMTPRQLACTFLGAIVGETWAAFVQIGDGVIVFGGEAGYELAFWPDNGEYANTTRFLTDDDYRQNLRIEFVERSITELAVLTDGLQMLALDFGQAKVHDRFFTPLFKTVRNGPDEGILRTSLLEFMDSKRVNDRTDDDKTLLLATRNAPDVSPSLSDATT
ncbi:Protein phosphatase 2C [Singulisphaera sp. GP187]|uniref:PP2C family serine/threonine-protein phosphatase n=1 Tax=Singulisphaera sp. GP187 TaxID=1882752 RepID=UPI000928BF4D|nr:PP2C family serine/threonine-protein phosphatase [Singulisphaera sp. GP187]SIN70298.1 Protein phosphatase 2C [Singulisphaera sp. GP187]